MRQYPSSIRNFVKAVENVPRNCPVGAITGTDQRSLIILILKYVSSVVPVKITVHLMRYHVEDVERRTNMGYNDN